MIRRTDTISILLFAAFFTATACSKSGPTSNLPANSAEEANDTPVVKSIVVPGNTIAIDYISTEANKLLTDCSNRVAEACDAAQRNDEISNDGVFSRIHSGCNSGEQAFCALLDGLVAAELRMRGVVPESAPGTGTGAGGMMITPPGSQYDCSGERVIIAFEAGAAYMTDSTGQSTMLPVLDANASPLIFTNGRLTLAKTSVDSVETVTLAKGRAVAMPCAAVANN